VKAADDPNVDIMKKLFTKIANAVGVGSNDPLVGSSYLVLANPGILIDPKLDMNQPADYYRLSRTLDRVLTPTWIYRPTSERTVDVYSTILEYHEAPVIKPNQAQQKLLDDAKKKVYADVAKRTYSQQFNDFRTKRRALATATKAVEDYQRSNPNMSVPASLLNDLQEATEDYNLVGNKNEMIAAQAVIDTYEHLDPNVWWGNLSTQFLFQTRTFNNVRFGTYDFYPTYSQWYATDREWTKLSLSQKDLEQTSNSSQTSVSGGFGVDFGLFSVGADYTNEQNRTYFKLDVSEYTVSMELTTVLIDRPWMNATVFRTDAWRWLASTPYAGRLVSDGANPSAGQAPSGIMPFLPTALLLARNVSISGKWSADLSTTFSQRTSGGASIGWGPFSFGGRTNSADSNSYIKANTAGNTLSWNAPQILGFFVDVLPKSPNPGSYTWPDPTDTLTKLNIELSDELLRKAQELLKLLKKQ
jgi:hypothetical protein